MRPYRSLLGATVLAALMTTAAVGTAFADDSDSFNNATVTISGGNAKAAAVCLNFARAEARANHFVQVNRCKNVATATGGSVSLKDVSVDILQSSTGSDSFNNADVSITGGNATAVAACVNVLDLGANADPAQINKCKNSATATGGNVDLRNVSITVFQG